jgi:hypothetical protein
MSCSYRETGRAAAHDMPQDRYIPFPSQSGKASVRSRAITNPGRPTLQEQSGWPRESAVATNSMGNSNTCLSAFVPIALCSDSMEQWFGQYLKIRARLFNRPWQTRPALAASHRAMASSALPLSRPTSCHRHYYRNAINRLWHDVRSHRWSFKC